MLSILILSLLFVLSLFTFKNRKYKLAGLFPILLLNWLVIELVIYGYFLYLVFQGQCFLLIGNQKILDILIKTRLTHAIYFAQGKKNFIYQVNSDLGYGLGKNKDTGLYRTNQMGFRADQEYALLPGKNTLRLAAFGDSFVFCDDEKNTDTWPHFLEQSAGHLEALNFGVSGYGLGQSYLRYLNEGLKFNPDIIFFTYIELTNRDRINPLDFIGINNLRMANFYRAHFWIENDVLLSENTTPFHLFDPSFRKQYLYDPLKLHFESSFLANPFFSISNLGLLIKTILIQKIVKDKKIQPENYTDETLNLKILENLIRLAEKNQSSLIFWNEQSFSKLPQSIQNLVKQHEENVVYVNQRDAFYDLYLNLSPDENLRNKSQHFNARGNQLYAQAVLDILKSRSWGKGARRFKFDPVTASFVPEASSRQK